MAKKRKTSRSDRNYLALGIKYFFTGIYWIIKNIVLGIWWVISYFYYEIKKIEFIRKKDIENEEIKKEVAKNIPEKQIKKNNNAAYHEFLELQNLNGEYSNFENTFLNNPSTIGIILGARGTGKSAIGLKLLENIYAKTGRAVFTMGFKTEDLPNWIHNIANIEEIKNNSVILLDESGITFSSRESMSNINKLLTNLMLVARHKDVSLLFISQNSSNIDINIIRQSDFLLLKPSSLLQKDFERKKINDIYKEAEKYFKEYKHEKGLTYIYSENYRGFVLNPLPSFWTTNLSKAFRQKN
ncbi:hypothetical protein J4216_06140 [Candidatus Woesearchaeota archaeon]|nr:hypothetical protein [Candidatus Woesearchaeota archaeon]